MTNRRKLPMLMTILALVTVPAAGQADLEAYIEEIREAGMTGDARSAIGAVAAILAGTTILSAVKEEGHYGWSYSSAFCALPGAEPEAVAKIQAENAAKVEAQIAFLKPFADFDASGFVNPEEGVRFRQVAELGLWAARMEDEDTGSLEAFTRALRRPEDWVIEQATAYEALVERIAGSEAPEGATLPPLPFRVAGERVAWAKWALAGPRVACAIDGAGLFSATRHTHRSVPMDGGDVAVVKGEREDDDRDSRRGVSSKQGGNRR